MGSRIPTAKLRCGKMSLLLHVLLLFLCISLTISYPFHASCHIKWEIETSCDSLQSRLIQQIGTGRERPIAGRKVILVPHCLAARIAFTLLCPLRMESLLLNIVHQSNDMLMIWSSH